MKKTNLIYLFQDYVEQVWKNTLISRTGWKNTLSASEQVVKMLDDFMNLAFCLCKA
jgi:hypothetical protein